jgi:hypothetical protein
VIKIKDVSIKDAKKITAKCITKIEKTSGVSDHDQGEETVTPKRSLRDLATPPFTSRKKGNRLGLPR